jgi:hypothetical protein
MSLLHKTRTAYSVGTEAVPRNASNVEGPLYSYNMSLFVQKYTESHSTLYLQTQINEMK